MGSWNEVMGLGTGQGVTAKKSGFGTTVLALAPERRVVAKRQCGELSAPTGEKCVAALAQTGVVLQNRRYRCPDGPF
jgi:hypothetical protein